MTSVENKPILLIIHKTWCGACQSKNNFCFVFTLNLNINLNIKIKELKQALADSMKFKEMSQKFLMVNLEVIIVNK